jgi:hypothetical protein
MSFTKIESVGIASTGTLTIENLVVTGNSNLGVISGTISVTELNSTTINSTSYNGIVENVEMTLGSSLGTSGTVNLDMDLLSGTYQTIPLTGNITFTTSNKSVGRYVTLRLISDASYDINFPAQWKFVGTNPPSVLVSNFALVSILFFGSNESDCVASIILGA